MRKTIRILLVDDHALFRKGLAGVLSSEEDFQLVGEAENGNEAWEKAKKLKPDLVLMDIYMPGGNGLEALRKIKEDVPAAKVVILTVSEEDKNLFEAIKAGANGYVLKDVDPEALFEMLRGVVRGEAPLSASVAVKLVEEFAGRSRTDLEKDITTTLTEREQKVLALLTQGLTNKDIGNRLGIAENTVKNHLKNILGKLHVENRVQAATLALQRGLVSKKDQSE